MNEQGRSFEARDRYLDQLAVAHAEGRIDDDEFDRRSQAALRTDDPPHLPPERPRRSRPMTRRVVLAGGAAVAALAAVTWITQGPPEPDPLSAERAFTGLTEAVALSRFWGLEASLRTDGLTLIHTLDITPTEITGTASRPATPDEDASFRLDSAGIVQVSAAPPADPAVAAPAVGSVELDRLAQQFDVAVAAAGAEVPGELQEVRLVGTGEEPALELTFLDGDRARIAVVDLDGRVVAQRDA